MLMERGAVMAVSGLVLMESAFFLTAFEETCMFLDGFCELTFVWTNLDDTCTFLNGF